MAKLVIIQGHPDNTEEHLGHALAKAYQEGAAAGGHEVRTIQVANLEFGFVRSRREWQGQAPPDIRAAQESVAWADHLVIFYPLWLGTMPALLKGFLEQLLRPGFALDYEDNGFPKRLLGGKSARVVVTMGMPALAYRWFFRAHSLKSLERNILKLCGIAPVRETLVGMVETQGQKKRDKWFGTLRRLGQKGQ